MREYIVDYMPWLLSALTIVMTYMLGTKHHSGWVFGLLMQPLWIVWIVASKNWGLLPLNAMLTVLYSINAVKWKEPVDASAKFALLGWVVSDAGGEKFRCWDCGPAWTLNPHDALHFTRRADAESFAAEDEDAWRILLLSTALTMAESEARRLSWRASSA